MAIQQFPIALYVSWLLFVDPFTLPEFVAATYARDHIKDNVRQLADMQEAAAARREAAELPAEPVFKLKRFESVPSKVAASMVRTWWQRAGVINHLQDG